VLGLIAADCPLSHFHTCTLGGIGVLTPIKRTKDGKTFYCLQYGSNGRHVSKYVLAEEVGAYREHCETSMNESPSSGQRTARGLIGGVRVVE